MERYRQVTERDGWLELLSFLPAGWEEKAKELGAFSRARRFSNPEVLLRVLLMHIAEGNSLRMTSVLANQTGLAKVSDVAIMRRLAAANEWFRWMANEVKNKWFAQNYPVPVGDNFRVRIVDGTTVQEPGATGTTWKIHYSINLVSLNCDDVLVTDPKTGEGFWNYHVNQGDLFIADRGFCNRRGICHVVERHGEVIVRVKSKMPFLDEDGNNLNFLSKCHELTINEAGDWDASIEIDGKQISGRICAIRKSKEAADKEKHRIMKAARKKQRKVYESTIDATNYIIIFTTLPKSYDTKKVLEYYRLRWQVELSFKRLKSILGLGHLKKFDETSARAWLHGKLLIAFLMEAISSVGEVFFPWGYPICGKELRE